MTSGCLEEHCGSVFCIPWPVLAPAALSEHLTPRPYLINQIGSDPANPGNPPTTGRRRLLQAANYCKLLMLLTISNEMNEAFEALKGFTSMELSRNPATHDRIALTTLVTFRWCHIYKKTNHLKLQFTQKGWGQPDDPWKNLNSSS